jgi:hypothetical protein
MLLYRHKEQDNNIQTQQRKGVNIMKTYELKPTNNRKSFYGKAIIIERENGDIELRSYDTIVARIRNGSFQRLWSGYSATTMNHVNAFIDTFGISGGGKAWWVGLEVVS